MKLLCDHIEGDHYNVSVALAQDTAHLSAWLSNTSGRGVMSLAICQHTDQIVCLHIYENCQTYQMYHFTPTHTHKDHTHYDGIF